MAHGSIAMHDASESIMMDPRDSESARASERENERKGKERRERERERVRREESERETLHCRSMSHRRKCVLAQ